MQAISGQRSAFRRNAEGSKLIADG